MREAGLNLTVSLGRGGPSTHSRAESPAGAENKGALLPKQTFLPEVVASQRPCSVLGKVFSNFGSLTSPTSDPAKELQRQSKLFLC